MLYTHTAAFALVLALAAVPYALPTNEEMSGPPLASDPSPATGLQAPAASAIPAADAWRQAAATGESLMLVLDGATAHVRVAINNDLWNGALDARLASGERVATEHIAPLAGHVLDAEGSWVRVTVSDHRVVGALWAPGLGTWNLVTDEAGTVRALADAALARLPGYGGLIDTDARAAPAVALGEKTDGGPDCLSAVVDPAPATMLIDGVAMRTLDVAFPTDEGYVAAHDDWVGDMVAMANTLDALYERDFGLSISIVHTIVVPDADMPGLTSATYLDQIAAYYATHYLDLPRDAVYLSVGNANASFGGQAACIGGAGFPDEAYGVGTTDSGGPYSFTGFETLLPGQHYKIAAHEVGHLLTAHHHHANCVETAPAYDPLITLDGCTVMINDWGLIHPTFSSLNRLVVRGHADQQDL